MSGGSYNYLCHSDFPEIMDRLMSIQEMAEALEHYGFNDIAGDSKQLILDLLEIERKMNERINALQPVWKAIEWHDSNDWSFDAVTKEVDNYRKLKSN